MTRFDLELAAQLAALHGGLLIDPDKAYLFESRLAPVARRAGLGSVEALMLVVRDGQDDDLVRAIVEAFSPASTTFFRDPETLDRLVGQVLPALAAARPAEPLRIWVAAAGSGQEAFSLAILLDEQPPTAAGVEVLASDLSERALEKARSGTYSQFEVQMGLSARRLVRCFEKSGEAFVASPRLRQAVRWTRRNLMEPPQAPGSYDVVMCRHALPAMTAGGRSRALAALLDGLNPRGGILVMGASEPAPSGMMRMAPGLYAARPQARVAA